MATRPHYSQENLLEKYRIALDNVQKNTQIAPIMAEFDYDANKITEGEELWQVAYNAYKDNKAKNRQNEKMYAIFSTQKAKLEKIYRNHRKKSKVALSKTPLLLIDLGIKGSIPYAYAKWLETIKVFYITALANTDIKQGLSRIKITEEELIDAQSYIDALQVARSGYQNAKADSQEATKVKNNAFEVLNQWMKDFYAIAKIALEEHPQLMEALGKVVKS